MVTQKLESNSCWFQKSISEIIKKIFIVVIGDIIISLLTVVCVILVNSFKLEVT